MENESTRQKYPEYSRCKYWGDTCATVGCMAAGLLHNLRDARRQPDTPERAQNIMNEARQKGCPNSLSYS